MNGRMSGIAIFWLACLLVSPVLALDDIGVNPVWAISYAVVINTICYALYAMDKKRAEAGAWRIPENWLHLTELLGGWPAAFVAQRKLRHKCSKGSYQLMFLLIVIGYQYVALDSLLGWKMSLKLREFAGGVKTIQSR